MKFMCYIMYPLREALTAEVLCQICYQKADLGSEKAKSWSTGWKRRGEKVSPYQTWQIVWDDRRSCNEWHIKRPKDTAMRVTNDDVIGSNNSDSLSIIRGESISIFGFFTRSPCSKDKPRKIKMRFFFRKTLAFFFKRTRGNYQPMSIQHIFIVWCCRLLILFSFMFLLNMNNFLTDRLDS